jgi:hypothetical protein
MKSLKQFILGVLLIAVVGAVCVFYLVDSTLNTVVKNHIELRGTYLVGTVVTVEKVELAVRSGRGSIQGFKIASPEGYSAPHALWVEHMEVVIDPTTLHKPKIVIELLHIKAPHVIYVQGLGSSNLHAILENVSRHAEPGAPAAPPPPESEAGKQLSVRFVVRKLIIDDGRVGLGLSGEQVGIPLKTMHAENLGAEGEGLSGPELTNEILRRILQPSLDVVVVGALNEGLRTASDVINKTGEAIEGLLGGEKDKKKQ